MAVLKEWDGSAWVPVGTAATTTPVVAADGVTAAADGHTLIFGSNVQGQLDSADTQFGSIATLIAGLSGDESDINDVLVSLQAAVGALSASSLAASSAGHGRLTGSSVQAQLDETDAALAAAFDNQSVSVASWVGRDFDVLGFGYQPVQGTFGGDYAGWLIDNGNGTFTIADGVVGVMIGTVNITAAKGGQVLPTVATVNIDGTKVGDEINGRAVCTSVGMVSGRLQGDFVVPVAAGFTFAVIMSQYAPSGSPSFTVDLDARIVKFAAISGIKGDKGSKGDRGDPGTPGSAITVVTTERWLETTVARDGAFHHIDLSAGSVHADSGDIAVDGTGRLILPKGIYQVLYSVFYSAAMPTAPHTTPHAAVVASNGPVFNQSAVFRAAVSGGAANIMIANGTEMIVSDGTTTASLGLVSDDAGGPDVGLFVTISVIKVADVA